MTAPTREHALADLLAKQDITELLTRYLRAVDRGDIAALRACYQPGATEDHGGVFVGLASDYVDSVVGPLTHPRSLSMHMLTNVLIEVDGDRATAECYVTAFARVRTAEGPADSLVGARMLDELHCIDGTWGIRHRQLLWEWNHDMAVREGWIFGLLIADEADLRRGSKHPDDPVYATRR